MALEAYSRAVEILAWVFYIGTKGYKCYYQVGWSHNEDSVPCLFISGQTKEEKKLFTTLILKD